MTMPACGSGGSGDADGRAGNSPDRLAVSVASYDLAAGAAARFLAGLETNDRQLITYGSVEMNFSFLGRGRASKPSPGPRVTAVFLPVAGSVVPDPPPADPAVVSASEARGVYSAMVGFDRAGFWEVGVSASVDGEIRSGTGAFEVLASHRLPAVGDTALATENLTLKSADVPRGAIDSRADEAGVEVPDPELHGTTIAAALAAKRPIVAVFATPVYCTSRFCGPVTDTVAELARHYGDRAAFVHVEVWRDFQEKIVNEAASEWLLRDNELTEPWVYMIGTDGRITARFDNVVNRADLEPLLAGLPPS